MLLEAIEGDEREAAEPAEASAELSNMANHERREALFIHKTIPSYDDQCEFDLGLLLNIFPQNKLAILNRKDEYLLCLELEPLPDLLRNGDLELAAYLACPQNLFGQASLASKESKGLISEAQETFTCKAYKANTRKVRA